MRNLLQIKSFAFVFFIFSPVSFSSFELSQILNPNSLTRPMAAVNSASFRSELGFISSASRSEVRGLEIDALETFEQLLDETGTFSRKSIEIISSRFARQVREHPENLGERSPEGVIEEMNRYILRLQLMNVNQLWNEIHRQLEQEQRDEAAKGYGYLHYGAFDILRNFDSNLRRQSDRQLDRERSGHKNFGVSLSSSQIRLAISLLAEKFLYQTVDYRPWSHAPRRLPENGVLRSETRTGPSQAFPLLLKYFQTHGQATVLQNDSGKSDTSQLGSVISESAVQDVVEVLRAGAVLASFNSEEKRSGTDERLSADSLRQGTPELKVFSWKSFFDSKGNLGLAAKELSDLYGSFMVVVTNEVEFSVIRTINQQLDSQKQIIPIRSFQEARAQARLRRLPLYAVGIEGDVISLRFLRTQGVIDDFIILNQMSLHRLLSRVEHLVAQFQAALHTAYSA